MLVRYSLIKELRNSVEQRKLNQAQSARVQLKIETTECGTQITIFYMLVVVLFTVLSCAGLVDIDNHCLTFAVDVDSNPTPSIVLNLLRAVHRARKSY